MKSGWIQFELMINLISLDRKSHRGDSLCNERRE